jgi:hypothetical protein
MTYRTVIDLCNERLRELRTKRLNERRAAALEQERLKAEAGKVVRLVQRDVLLGAQLPHGATVEIENSTEHGHSVAIRFPEGNVRAHRLYTPLQGDELGTGGVAQSWAAQRFHPDNKHLTGKQKRFDDILDAIIWLLDLKLEDSNDSA